MIYNFKPAPEAVWFVVVTVATAMLQFIVDNQMPTDWRAWATALGAAAIRALLGAILNAVNNNGEQD